MFAEAADIQQDMLCFVSQCQNCVHNSDKGSVLHCKISISLADIFSRMD